MKIMYSLFAKYYISIIIYDMSLSIDTIWNISVEYTKTYKRYLWDGLMHSQMPKYDL